MTMKSNENHKKIGSTTTNLILTDGCFPFKSRNFVCRSFSTTSNLNSNQKNENENEKQQSKQSSQQPTPPKTLNSISNENSKKDNNNNTENENENNGQQQQQKQRKTTTNSSNSSKNTQESIRSKNLRLGYIVASIGIAVVGLSYAAVPLYRMFCQATGFGGTTKRTHAADLKEMRNNLTAEPNPITVTFTTSVSANLDWEFRPVQNAVTVLPGESSLAFFKAKNRTDTPIIGVATYMVTPMTVSD